MKSSQRLLSIVAMEAELNSVTQTLGKFREIILSENLKLRARVFCSEDGISEIFLVHSGIGLVNAALATACALDKEKFSGILLLGVAGALREDLEIGDLIVAESVLQHDSLFCDESGDHLMAPGSLYVSAPLQKRVSPIFETDSNLQGLILDSAIRRRFPKNIVKGCLVSGSRFEANIRGKLNLSQIHTNVLGVDMEAAGVAIVAQRAQVPFLVLKTVADRLSPAGGITEDYKNFLTFASQNAGLATQLVWENFQKNLNTNSREKLQ